MPIAAHTNEPWLSTRLQARNLTWVTQSHEEATFAVPTSCDDGGATWFFSSYGGILELRRGIQAASCVGPGKSNLPFELRKKAGDCSRVTAGPIDLI